MKNVSDTIYTLLREVDSICRKEGIPCFLSPALARTAALDQDLDENPLNGIVYIFMRDMNRFRTAAEKNLPEKRELDSMEENGRFPGFFFFYSASDTVCYCFNRGRNYRYPGIGIYICPLRPEEIPGIRYRWIHKLEQGWVKTCDLYGETISPEERWYIGMVRILGLIMTRKRLGRFIYGQLCLCGRNRNAGKELAAEKGSSKSFPVSLFEKKKRVTIRDAEFSVPSRLGTYLTLQYGKGWRRHKVPPYEPSNVWIVSPVLSYKELFEACPWIYRSSSDRRRLFVTWDAWGENIKSNYEELWDSMKQLESRQELERFYLERTVYIRNLLDSRDAAKLKKVFKPLKVSLNERGTAWGDRPFDKSVMELYSEYQALAGALKESKANG